VQKVDETDRRKTRFDRENVALATIKFLGSTVSGYRLYCLDGVNKVASADWIEADDDEAAIEVAKNMMDGHECEVWQGRRLVVRLDFRVKR
jgi:hypothetical protein